MRRSDMVRIDSEELRIMLKNTGMQRHEIAKELGLSVYAVGRWLNSGSIRAPYLAKLKAWSEIANDVPRQNYCPSCGYCLKSKKAA